MADPDHHHHHRCGLTCWRPCWLQRFATARSFLLIFGLLGTIQTMSFMYFTITLTTLERRFKIPSGTTGIVLSGNEISQILLSLVLSYIGGQQHRPRWIACGGYMSAISCLMLAAAHFLFGPGDEALQLTREYVDRYDGEQLAVKQLLMHNSTAAAPVVIPRTHGLCTAVVASLATATPSLAATTDVCDEAARDLYSILPLLLIFVSQFVLGVGTTLYYTLGNTYLDDGVQKGATPMTMAYALVFRVFGNVLGFGLVHISLQMYIDPWSTPLIDSNDPRWLGAYWFGWLVLGIGMTVASWLVGMFPRVLPTKQQQRNVDGYTVVSQQQQQPMLELPKSADHKMREAAPQTINKAPSPSMQGFWAALQRLLRNKLLMYNNIANVFYMLGASAYFTFIAKYMEVQFNRDTATATMITGPINIMSMVSGFLLSGWLITKYRPAPRKLFLWNLIVGAIGIGGQVSNLFLACDSASVVGSTEAMAALQMACNANCSCAHVSYSPVCDVSEGRTYYSPCHAGCAEWSDARRVYEGCGCAARQSEAVYDDVFVKKLTSFDYGGYVDSYSYEEDFADDYEGFVDETTSSTTTEHTTKTWSTTERSSRSKRRAKGDDNLLTMIPGACAAGCATAFLIYNIISCVMNWLGASARISNILLSFRVVPVEDKSFAQGFILWTLSLLALIPGPILFGYIIDSTCLVWNTNKCGSGERGNCQLYDQAMFRWSINLGALFFTVIGVGLDGMVWWHAWEVDMYGDHDDDDEGVGGEEVADERAIKA